MVILSLNKLMVIWLPLPGLKGFSRSMFQKSIKTRLASIPLEYILPRNLIKPDKEEVRHCSKIVPIGGC